MKTLYTTHFAAVYGAGSYGANSYACTTAQQQAGTCNPSTSASGSLSNTGIAIVGIVTLACLIIFVGIVVRVWRRKPSLETVEVEDDQDDARVSRASRDEQDEE